MVRGQGPVSGSGVRMVKDQEGQGLVRVRVRGQDAAGGETVRCSSETNSRGTAAHDTREKLAAAARHSCRG